MCELSNPGVQRIARVPLALPFRVGAKNTYHEEGVVKEREDEFGMAEPEQVVVRPHERGADDDAVLVLHLQSHSRYDHFQFGPNDQHQLQFSISSAGKN